MESPPVLMQPALARYISNTFSNILHILDCTQAVDNLFHLFMVLSDNQCFSNVQSTFLLYQCQATFSSLLHILIFGKNMITIFITIQCLKNFYLISLISVSVKPCSFSLSLYLRCLGPFEGPSDNNNNKSIYIAPWLQVTLFKGTDAK